MYMYIIFSKYISNTLNKKYLQKSKTYVDQKAYQRHDYFEAVHLKCNKQPEMTMLDTSSNIHQYFKFTIKRCLNILYIYDKLSQALFISQIEIERYLRFKKRMLLSYNEGDDMDHC